MEIIIKSSLKHNKFWVAKKWKKSKFQNLARLFFLRLYVQKHILLSIFGNKSFINKSFINKSFIFLYSLLFYLIQLIITARKHQAIIGYNWWHLNGHEHTRNNEQPGTRTARNGHEPPGTPPWANDLHLW